MQEMIGQFKVRERLSNSILRHTVSHAYIFEGPSGIGKKTLAREFAMAIHCEEGKGTPCGVCHACRMHLSGNHPDYHVVEEEKKESTGVDHIRELIEDVYLKPMIAEKKVYVIPKADTLTVQAQNALLKVFEEPPSDSVMILISENSEKLLATIQSRGNRVVLERHPENEISAYIQANYPERAAEAAFITRFADGRIGQAKALCEDTSFQEKRAELFHKLALLPKGESRVFDVRDFLTAHKDERDMNFSLILSYFRDAWRIKMGMGNLLNEDFHTEIEEFAGTTTAQALSRAADAVMRTGSQISRFSNMDIWFLEMLLNGWRELYGTSHRRPVS